MKIDGVGNLCLWCMKEIGDSPCCPYCGHDEREAMRTEQGIPAGNIIGGHYLLGRTLGQGGFGITYLAYDLDLHVKRAIKEYFPRGLVTRVGNTVRVSLQSEMEVYQKGVDSFYREAQSIAQFGGHPNVVQVHAFFRENNSAYFVMDYVEGISFQQYLDDRGGRISLEEALRILKPIGEALTALHESHLLHRDVKPANIFITRNGTPKLLDFGAARYETSESSHISTPVLTPGYAPVEQYGSMSRQGTFTDVYALSATFYRAISGIVPVPAPDRMLEDVLLPLDKVDSRVPAQIGNAIAHGMGVRSGNRPQTVEQFLKELEPAQKQKLPKWLLPVLAVFAVLVLGVCLWKFVSNESAEKEARLSETAEAIALTRMNELGSPTETPTLIEAASPIATNTPDPTDTLIPTFTWTPQPTDTPVVKGNIVAEVDGEPIYEDEFSSHALFIRYQYLSQYQQYAQLYSSYGLPLDSLNEQIERILGENGQEVLGGKVIDQLVYNKILEKEAEKAGYELPEQDVIDQMKQMLGYEEKTTKEDPAAGIHSYNVDLNSFKDTEDLNADFKQYAETMLAYSYQNDSINYDFLTSYVRSVLLDNALFEKELEDRVFADEMVNARHILVEDEETAKEVQEKLANGEAWEDLASRYSIDESNKDDAGNLGWFARGEMVSEFEEAAFALEPGDTSEPVQTSYGYHLINSLGKEVRPLEGQALQSAQNKAYTEWTTALRAAYDTKNYPEVWTGLVPLEPAFTPIETETVEEETPAEEEAAAEEASVPGVITDEIRNAQVGDHVFYGHYEQNNNQSDGAEAIEWRVLAREENRLLLLSEVILDAMPYHTELAAITWERSTLRKWLNEDFYQNAFSEDEQRQIALTDVKAEANPNYATNTGEDTQDKVFLLNIQEVNLYFQDDKDRRAKVSPYAEKNGVYNYAEYDGTGWWWLRSSGDQENRAAYISEDGSVYAIGSYVYHDYGAVRPALWLNL